MSLDLSDVKPSLVNWLVVGLLAVTFIVVGKYALNRWPVPGLTALFNAV